MANTKKLPAAKRRAAKRTSRKALRALYGTLTKKQRSTLIKEKKSVKGLLAEAAKAAKAAS